MNLRDVLMLPRHATQPTTYLLCLLIFAPCSLAAIAIALGWGGGEKDNWLAASALYSAGLLMLWAFPFPCLLLLAMDARALRLPGVQAQILPSLLLWALLCLLPLIALNAGQPGHLPSALLLCALLMAGALCFSLLPRYVALVIGLSPSLLHAALGQWSIAGPADPGFAHWALPLLAGLVAIAAIRWRQLLHAGSATLQGWSSPIVMQQRQGRWGAWSGLGDGRMSLARPEWLRIEPALAGTGPQAPRRSLRVALGGWYLPQTAGSYLRQLGFMLAIVALPLAGSAWLGLQQRHDPQLGAFARGLWVGLGSGLGVMAGPITSLLTGLWLYRRWNRPQGELSLLGLLPGLGEPAQQRRQLLHAGLSLPLLAHAALLLLLASAGLSQASLHPLLQLPLLSQLGCAMVTVAVVLHLLAGRELKQAAPIGLLVAGFALNLLSYIVTTVRVREPAAIPMAWLATLLTAELILLLLAAWQALRGWQAMQRRAHPFLPVGNG